MKIVESAYENSLENFPFRILQDFPVLEVIKEKEFFHSTGVGEFC